MKTRNVVIGLAVGLVVLLVVGLLLGSALWGRSAYHRGPGMMWGSGVAGGMHSLGGGILMVIFWALLLGLLVGGGILLTGALTQRNARQVEEKESPLEILKRRYALGEIDREEFERMREALLEERGE
jgi:putative membrane protein